MRFVLVSATSSFLALSLGLVLFSSVLNASDAPTPPDSPLRRLVGQLAAKRAAPGAPTKRKPASITKT